VGVATLHAGVDHDGLWSAWSPDAPALVAVALAAALLYLAAWRRLRRRGRADLAPAWRAAAFLGGLAVLVLALVSPLDEIGERYLLSAHMAQHLLIGDIAPLLLVAALAGPLMLLAVPRPVLRRAGRAPALRRALAVAGRPVTAFALWTAVMVGWHVPAAFDLALEHRWAHDLEHASMVLAGLLVWAVVLGAAPRTRMSSARRAAFAVGLFAVSTAVSQALLLSGPLYEVYAEQQHRLLGLGPAADQTRAALLMGTEQLMTLGVAAGLLLWSHVERASGRGAPVAAVPARTGPTSRPRR
jgi:cytochrome c oxidase assembly factor CtaG